MTPKPKKQRRWDYKCYEGKALDYAAMQKDLQELGRQGYEFCVLFDGCCFVFKRPK